MTTPIDDATPSDNGARQNDPNAHNDTSHLGWALRYARRDWAVFPLHEPVFDEAGKIIGCSSGKTTDPNKIGKSPRTKHGFKDATTDEAQIRAWWTKWPHANIGIATGEVSGFFAFDIDPRHAGDKSAGELERQHGPLPLPNVLTGGGGQHFYLGYPVGGIGCKTGGLPAGLDVRGDGGYVMAPPSLHGSGKRYLWMAGEGPKGFTPPPAPPWLVELIRADDGKSQGQDQPADEPPPAPGGLPPRVADILERDKKLKRRWNGSVRGLRDPSRSGLVTSIASGLVYHRAPRAEIDEALRSWGALNDYDKCAEPRWRSLTIDNAERFVADRAASKRKPRAADSAASSPGGAGEGKVSDLLPNLARDADLFHTPDREPYARVPVKEHHEVVAVRSRPFRLWLQGEFDRVYEGAPSNEGMDEAMKNIESKAIFRSPERTVHVRLAEFEGAYFLDLGDTDWRAVEIRPTGWRA